MMTGLTTIIGSGWLLSTQKISEIAGPASLIAWIVGMLVALSVSMFFIEIGSCYPSAGGIGFYSHITHGRFCGFLTSWINWLSIVAVPPIEAQAIVQYLSQLTPTFSQWYSPTTHALTYSGIGVAFLLMLGFMLINYWSVKLLLRFNNFFTIIKIIIPIITILALFSLGLHTDNFGIQSVQTFAPYGFKAIFISVVSCGVVMAFNGFQSPMTFSEEIEQPKRMLPIAVFGSILIAFVLYLLLQIVFIGSINPSHLIHGWSSVNMRSPYVDLLMFANLHLIVLMIYAGAVISPGACGSIFAASSSRILYSLSYEKHLPAFLSYLNPDYRTPRRAIITCTIVGCLFLLLFKGWYQLVAVISVLHIFSYVCAPVITLANRIKHPERLTEKQFKIPFAKIFAPAVLFILSVLLFYAAWPLTGEMAFLIVPGLFFYFYYEYKYSSGKFFGELFKGASWLLLYLAGISLITFLGNNPSHTINIISTPTSLIILALFSLFITVYGVRVAVKTPYITTPTEAEIDCFH